jgi:hypothetical protein
MMLRLYDEERGKVGEEDGREIPTLFAHVSQQS